MQKYFLFNETIVAGTTVPMNIEGSFFQYGVGLIESISAYQNEGEIHFFFLQEHLERIKISWKDLKLKGILDFNYKILKKKLEELILCYQRIGVRWLFIKIRFYEDMELVSYIATVKEVIAPGGEIEIKNNYLMQNDILRHYKTGFYMYEYLYKQLDTFSDEFVINENRMVVEARKGNILTVKGSTLYVINPKQKYLCGILQKILILQYKRWFSSIKYIEGMDFNFLKKSEILYTNSIRWVSSIKNFGKKSNLSQKILKDLLQDFKIKIDNLR